MRRSQSAATTMAANRKSQSAAIRFGPVLKALLLCLLIGGSVGGVLGALLAVPIAAAAEVILERMQDREVPVPQVADAPQPDDAEREEIADRPLDVPKADVPKADVPT